MDYRHRIRAVEEQLTRAERRAAEHVLAAPQSVGFGTVAEVAAAAGVGVATIARLAAKSGFGGFSELQRAVRDDLGRQLRPAAERIRERTGHDVTDRHTELAIANVRTTLAAVDDTAVSAAAALLADLTSPVLVVSGDASTGTAVQFVDELAALRPDVALLDGNEVSVRRAVAHAGAATVVVLDLRRYDRWVVDTVGALRDQGARVIALTDSELSPLGRGTAHTFVVAAGAVGPFDSHVGALALLELLAVGAAEQLTDVATERLERAEAAWTTAASLLEP